jgi:hypothetical protein
LSDCEEEDIHPDALKELGPGRYWLDLGGVKYLQIEEA